MAKHNCLCQKSKLPCSHILTKLLERYTQQELADIYGYNEKTVRRHLKTSNKHKQKRGRKRRFEGNNLDALRDYAISFEITTQKFLAKQFSCSQSTICISLRRSKVVFKKINYQSSEQLREKNQIKIEGFINQTIPSLIQSNANLFFLDESSFLLNLAPRRGYYLKGSRLVRQRPGKRGKNQSLILLSQIAQGEKIIHKRLVEGGVNSEKFHQFLSEFNPPNNGKENYLIMDNLSVHKATKSCQKLKLTTIEELMTSKNTKIIFTPSYTPELNPIETMLSILRKYVEDKQARERDILNSVIEERLVLFEKEDTTKYLRNSIRECLMKNKEIYRKRMRGAFVHIEYEVVELKDGSKINWIVDMDVIEGIEQNSKIIS